MFGSYDFSRYDYSSHNDIDPILPYSFSKQTGLSMAASTSKCEGIEDFETLYKIEDTMVSFRMGINLSSTSLLLKMRGLT